MKNKTRFFIGHCLILLFLAGCASTSIAKGSAEHNLLKNKLDSVDSLNGVNKEEAILIAQNYLIEEGLDKGYVIRKPSVKDYGAEWEVVFNATYAESMKKANIFGALGIFKWWISVGVNKGNGAVTSVGGPDL